jgi:hypothetical protein
MASNSPRNSRKLLEMVGFRSLNVTAEAASAVSMWPRKQLPRFQWDRGILIKNFSIIFLRQIGSFQHKTMSEKFGSLGFNETAEADSAVSIRPRKHIQWSQWDRRSGFGCFNETAEADLAVSMRLRNPWWHRGSLRENEYWPSIPLKGYYRTAKTNTYVNITYL